MNSPWSGLAAWCDRRQSISRRRLFVAAVLFVLCDDWMLGGVPLPADGAATLAYIGPGAGIALAGSLLAVLIAMFSALVALATWPIRWAWRAIRGRRAMSNAHVRRVVILGLDGLDPQLVDEFLDAGLLPNLAKLRESGTYARLGTTWPPLSPVAWSSFSTGTNPGKHNIFDFLTRDPVSYGPRISSLRIQPPRHYLPLGGYRLPLSSPRIEPLRKSKPFWSVLGEAGVFSAVLRVPITFPPDRFYGVQLSAMCVPDIRGTQGTFVYFSENGRATNGGTAASTNGAAPATRATEGDLGGERIAVRREGGKLLAELPGPENPLRADRRPTRVQITVTPGANGGATLQVAGRRVALRPNEFTEWIRVPFRLAPAVRVWGLCRFYLCNLDPFELYATAAHIDPAKPLMPISHPKVYSIYLAKQQGPFATLGLAEDTWSLSEGLMSEVAFLSAAYDIDAERQQMFFDALERVNRGLVACVFDAPDRIQHMFWRFRDDRHPARGSDQSRIDAHRHTIRDMYVRMDELVGRTLARIDDRTALLVMSDHGFKPFRRGVDLNAWLRENGYLKLKNDAVTSDRAYMADVDWLRTQAFALGLAGIFINQAGREGQGIVAKGAATEQLVRRICSQLSGLRDAEQGEVAIHQAVPRESVYHGPYVAAAPDIIVGYNVGYRVAWDAAVGKCGPAVLADNTKAWSGDHCIHPELVPGVLFSNRPLAAVDANIIDLGPTALELLGVSKPAYMDGKSLVCSGENSST